MRYLLIVLILISTQIISAEKGDIHLTQGSFNRYVYPQLRSIKADFASLLKEIHPFNSTLYRPYQGVLGFVSQISRKDLKICEDLYTKECSDYVSKLKNSLLKVDHELLSVQKRINLRIKKTKGKRDLDKYLLALNHITDLHDEVMQTSDYLKNLATILNTELPIETNILVYLEGRKTSMEAKANLMLLSMSAKNRRDSFLSVLVGMIRPLELFVINPRDREFFIENLGRYNILWNDFNMKITKTNERYNKGIVSYTKKIHQRWTNILKVTLI